VTDSRTLPLRVAPQSGEALDSWLEALAVRHRAPFGDLIQALGLATESEQARQRPPGSRRVNPPNWTVAVGDTEAAALASACELDTATVHDLTLARYDGIAVQLDTTGRRVIRHRLWGRAKGSRFCPACLRENNGRWSLSWRLGWAFACPRHRCLLADTCPACDRPQRLASHPFRFIPHPGHCAQNGQHAIGRNAPRCGADLTDVPVLALPEGHPVLRAEHTIHNLIQTQTAHFGIYQADPQPAVVALTDLRTLGRKILTEATSEDLGHLLSADIANEFTQARSRPHRRADPSLSEVRPGFGCPGRAVLAAVAVSAALDALHRPEHRDAGQALRWLLRPRRKPDGTVLSERVPLTDASPVLRAVQRASLAPPAAGHRTVALDPAGIPALLWPEWTVRLAPTTRQCRQTVQMLAHVLTLVLITQHGGISPDAAAAHYGHLVPQPHVGHLLHRLERHTGWPAITTALARLARHLHAQPAPINYTRRRHLDYRELLPDSCWDQLRQPLGIAPHTSQRRRWARQWLFERLTAIPADHAPPDFAITTPQQRAHLAIHNAAKLTPGLMHALDAPPSSAATASPTNHSPGSHPANYSTDFAYPAPTPTWSTSPACTTSSAATSSHPAKQHAACTPPSTQCATSSTNTRQPRPYRTATPRARLGCVKDLGQFLVVVLVKP
jgi:hypothetical protein